MFTIVDLTLEIIDRILFILDPLDIARVSQTSRFFYEIIYGPLNRQFWRGLYLAQPLDDPRRSVARLGCPRGEDIDWKGELQRIVRARTVMTLPGPEACRREERCQVLSTCIDLVTNIVPITSPDGVGEPSRNVQWMLCLVGDGTFLDPVSWEAFEEDEEQLLARLHALYGLTRRDRTPERRKAVQSFVYSLRNHTVERGYGPFVPGGGRRVDWAFLLMFVLDLALLLVDDDDDDEWYSPAGLVFSQSVIPRGLDLAKEDDWAGVEGLWSVRYGFIDHREFILYNDPSVPDDEPQDVSIFDDGEEALATLEIYIRVASTEPDPSHPTHPQINIIGELDGKFHIVGFVKLTDDDEVWVHYGGGNDNQMVWHCDAIGLGSIRSRCGFIGVWSTVFHDVEDPIGPFWLQREFLVEEDE